MSKFDTHGGYFAPKDYMRINEGGSHEENPNGGVQVGVDEQGIPNMLEEGEPVYKDYVYSDNIKASKKFLEANNIPLKYEGMLYSEIADSIFEESEERPNDPVSRNGLEVMLGRLADSQEQQKQDSERRKLERELSKLSPEELEALQQELVAAEEQAQPQEMVPEQQVAPEEQIPMEQMPMEQMPVEQQPVPVMADGGDMNKFAPGGPVKRDPWRILDLDAAAHNETYHDIYDWQPTMPNSVRRVHYLRDYPQPVIPDIHESPDNQGDINFDDKPVVGKVALFDVSKNLGTRVTAKSASSALRRNSLSSSIPFFADASKAIDDQNAIDIANNDKLNERSLDMLARGMNLPAGPTIKGDIAVKKSPDTFMPSSYDTDTSDVVDSGNVHYSPTFPRYAGAIGAGLLAAYDAFQEPDKYTATRINPYVPVGHISLQNQRYMPVDQNMIQNQMLAQGNSTQRSLRNSGIGPSTAAAIIAADNNTTGNLGTGFLQSWQANNQQRNAVIAANNQAEAQRAHFDYAVDAAKQRALNEAQVRNAQNDLMLQRLNYGAEGEKYAALSNQLNAGLNALSGIGRENYARNQANSNTALEGYRSLAGGIGAYLPYYPVWNPNVVRNAALGGIIKKIKK